MATSWIKSLTEEKEPLAVEAFSELPKHFQVVDKMGVLVKAKRAYSGDKVNFALRIEKHINEQIEKNCDGSKNSVINALLEFALLELNKQGKTLLAE